MKLLFGLSLLFSLVSAEDVFQLHGAGTTNPSKCYWSIFETLHEQASQPIKLSYRAVGSGQGQSEFVESFTQANKNAFGSGDIPLTEELYNQVTDNGNDKNLVHIPVLAGAVSFFHSVPGVPQLNLTACELSDIFTLKVTTWDHESILALNPNLPDAVKGTPIRVARRKLKSSSTKSSTQYLNSACTGDRQFPDELVSSLPDWPAGTVECQGSGGVTKCIQDVEGTIGYIDAGHGKSAGLSEVNLYHKGQYFNSDDLPIKDAITTDRLPANPDDDFSGVNFLNTEDGWPIVLMSYVYVKKNLTTITEDPLEQGLLIAFLETLFDDTYVETCAKNYGFVVLSDLPEIKAYAQRAIDMLVVSDASQSWSFETGTPENSGAGEFVFSVHRRQIADIERAGLIGDVDTINTDLGMLQQEVKSLATYQQMIADLEAKVKTLESQVSSMSDEFTQMEGANIETDNETSNVAKAGLALGVLSIFAWLIWMLAYVCKFFNVASDETHNAKSNNMNENSETDHHI